MPSVLITGSNRGLGLEWTRQYAGEGWRVYATCRHPSEADWLNELAESHINVTIHRLDVTRQDEIDALRRELLEESIDVLINNAGIYLEKFENVSLDRIRYEDWLRSFNINTIGCFRLIGALYKMIARSKKRLIVAISSHMGSITEIEESASYYYRSSKAALNAALKGLSFELRSSGIGVLILHPGWNNTRMGGPDGPFRPQETVEGMRKLIRKFAFNDTGRFFRFDGAEIPW